MLPAAGRNDCHQHDFAKDSRKKETACTDWQVRLKGVIFKQGVSSMNFSNIVKRELSRC